MKAAHGRRPLLSALLAPLVLAAAAGAYFALDGGRGKADDAGEPLSCAGPDVSRAAFLADLRKPLDPAHVALPGTELAVYALSPHAEAPRTLLGRLCKAVDLAGLASGSSKHDEADDCDLPAQAPPAARARARDFCRQRDALARRVDALAVETLGRAAGSAHLVEALESTARDFEGTPGTLYIFSDLMQHAAWFSHAETPSDGWDFEAIATAWSALPMEEQLRGLPPGTSVRIHYLPRAGTTDGAESRAAHKRSWASYFAGAEVAFDDQPAMAGYVPASLAEAPNAMELAAYELERLRHSGALVERERAEIERERAELARERRSVRNARREVEADRERLAVERRELAAARERLDANGPDLATASGPAADSSARIAAGEPAGDATGGGI